MSTLPLARYALSWWPDRWPNPPREEPLGYFETAAGLRLYLAEVWGGVEAAAPGDGFRIWEHDAAADAWHTIEEVPEP